MTVRAVIIGLLLGLALAAFGYFNDFALELPYLAGNLVPASVFGFLILGVALLNPLLRAARLGPLRSGEWGVVLALMLVASVIPGPSIMWQLTDVLVWPHIHYDREVGWQKLRLMDHVPPVLLADASEDRAAVLDAYVRGWRGRGAAPLGVVPWQAFSRTLGFWMPFFAMGLTAGVCLALVVHGQWAHRERLRYPVAEFAGELLTGAQEGGPASIFRNRRFLIGFAISFGILMVNGLKVWFPESIEIPLRFDLSSLAQRWPALGKVHVSWNLLGPRIFFVGIGFAYFLSGEVSFSIGISYVVFAAIWLTAMGLDVNLHGHFLGGGIWNYQMLGSYAGMALMILYVGRRFYGSVARRALGLSSAGEVDAGTAWAARVGALAAFGMALMLIFGVGLHWLLAVLFVLLIGMMFLVLTRINAETGLIIIQPRWHVVAVLAGLFGFTALGPGGYVALAILSAAVAIDPRSCLMPMVANSLRICEPQGVRPPAIGRWMVPAALAALVVGVGATMYVQYSFGSEGHFFWGKSVGAMPLRLLDEKMRAFPEARGPAGEFRWSQIRPDRTFMLAAGTGMVLVLVASLLRLRFTWWPIHPVLFLVWGTDTVVPLTLSFLIGWLIKTTVLRFGGSRVYQKNKALFVGLVAGEFVAGIAWAALGLGYYLVTGLKAKVFRVHPFS